MSLLRKFTLACGIVVLTVSVIQTSFVARTIYLDTLQQTETNNYSKISTSANIISQWFRSASTALTAVKKSLERANSDGEIISALIQGGDSSTFADVYAGYDNSDMYRVEGKNTQPYYDPAIRPWYRQGLDGNNISEPYYDKELKAYVTSFTEKIEKNGRTIGIVGSRMVLDELNNYISNMGLVEEGFSFLLAEQGWIISHSEGKYRNQSLTNISGDLSVSLIQTLADNHKLHELSIGDDTFLLSAVKVSGLDWYLVIAENKNRLTALLNSMLGNQLTILVAMLVIALLCFAALVRYLLKDLLRVSFALEDIAEGEGDLTVRIKNDSKDEVGKLAHNFNEFVGKMHGIISDVKTISDDLYDQSQIAATSSSDRNLKIEKQEEEITMVATSITELTTATVEIAQNAENTAENATHSVQLSQEGQSMSQKSQESINSLAEKISTAVNVIEELNSHSLNIHGIVEVISSVAEQTNLLALNAAIEAARAGEHGRGFAVVADEVRVLSQRTHQSTEEISQMLTELKNKAVQAVEVMSGCHKLADNSVSDTVKTNDALNKIDQSIQTINQLAAQIATAAEEQNVVTKEINSNTESVRQISSVLREEAIQGVSEAKTLADMSENLSGQVNKFKL